MSRVGYPAGGASKVLYNARKARRGEDGLFYGDSGFFDGKNFDFWPIGSKPFLWRILKTGGKARFRNSNRTIVNLPREKVEREVLSCRWSSTSRKWNSAPRLDQPFRLSTNSRGRIHSPFAMPCSTNARWRTCNSGPHRSGRDVASAGQGLMRRVR